MNIFIFFQIYPFVGSILGLLRKDVETKQTSVKKRGEGRDARERSTTKCAMRSRVTEAKSLVTQVIILQLLYKLSGTRTQPAFALMT